MSVWINKLEIIQHNGEIFGNIPINCRVGTSHMFVEHNGTLDVGVSCPKHLPEYYDADVDSSSGSDTSCLLCNCPHS